MNANDLSFMIICAACPQSQSSNLGRTHFRHFQHQEGHGPQSQISNSDLTHFRQCHCQEGLSPPHFRHLR